MARTQEFQPDPEQARVIASKAHHVVVHAPAGSGKTTTAIGYANARPEERALYLAFNAAVAREAATKFPSWVECRTGHSLAYGVVIPRLFSDLGRPDPDRGIVGWSAKIGDMRPLAIADLMGIHPRMASQVKTTLDNWLHSAEPKITEVHLPENTSPPQKPMVIQHAKNLFAKMCDDKNMAATLPHDGYLKIWQLMKPDLSSRYARIICDEAQDLNPTMLDVLQRQKTGLLVIGDEHQSIYQFRGSVNAMRSFESAEHLHLTKSYRFGRGVAQVANCLLERFSNLSHPIVGLGKHQETAFRIDHSDTYAVVSRTNAGLFDAAVSCLRTGKPYHFVGGVEKYRFDSMMDVHHLATGNTSAIRDPLLKRFEDLEHLRATADEVEDPELRFLAKIAATYGDRIPQLVEDVKSRHVAGASPNTLQQGIIFTTAHVSKGLEFDQVFLTNDFADLTDDKDSVLPADNIPVEEVNLFYVASTRAKRALQLNDSLRSYFHALKQETSQSTNPRAARP